MDDVIYNDIKRFEVETGITFRTAHCQTKGKYHHTVVPADLFSQKSKNYLEKISHIPE